MTETQNKLTLRSTFAAIMLLFLTFCAGNAFSAGEDFYTIRGISVDKTAASALEARQQAVAEGQRRAFSALYRKLTLKTDRGAMPQLSEEELTSMITGFQVSGEKTSAGRYIADLSYEFRREMILPILEANNIPYSESVSKPIVVLPVFDDRGVKNLWNEPNPWRDVWLNIFEGGAGPEGSQSRKDDWAQTKLLPIVVPSGTIDDFKAITVDQAVYLDKDGVANITDIYGAGAVLVAYATLQNNNGVRRLDISYQRSDFLSPAVVETFTGGDTDEDIFRAAIFDVVLNLQEGWKDQNILDRSIQNRLAITSKINNLQEWLQIKGTASNIPAVQQISVRELSVGNVFWEISFVGDLTQLKSALAQRDLILQNEEGYWTLGMSGEN
ncbi:DUF2066 domain-containing protein [Sneathiella sp. P13V-1]|uniref:DUF2066 domain-containing protein n=1 Tax=Sneathiella sp. P13V-1 TaxID=2697366 RepID=UPI00187B83A4|nr:DUF2066 domain-containing protein [Sneathiella sp. P13V-1]MBE7637148.1 DUF2066 domain-containing protein [Sneathiella sp. P13V-1]